MFRDAVSENTGVSGERAVSLTDPLPNGAPSYDIPDDVMAIVHADRLFGTLLATDEAISRLDERVRLSAVAEGLVGRLNFHNARAAMHSRHCIVHLEELILFDANAYAGPVHTEISTAASLVQLWRRAGRDDPLASLNSTVPGDLMAVRCRIEADARLDPHFDPDWDAVARITAWRRVLRQTLVLPPILAAAIVWDSWLAIDPDQRGPWRAPLLAALVLKARDKTHDILLPLDLGQRLSSYRWDARHPVEARLIGLCDYITTAARETSKELSKLALAEGLMRRKLVGRRRNSRLPALIDLLLAHPLVSIRMVAAKMCVSKQAVAVMMTQLGSTPREITERARYRCWTVT